MHGPTCVICDRGNTKLSKRDWCDPCETQFVQIMSMIKCEEDKNRHAADVCTSPISCMMRKTCVQMRATLQVMKNEPDNRTATVECDTRKT